MKPISNGMRFNIYVVDYTFTGVHPNGLADGMTMQRRLLKSDVPYSEVSGEVYRAGLTHNARDILLEPARFYSIEKFGI